ncbi:hypothetical protein BGX31_004460 [Mortierella sp. GBA43]|nr:hypothetical protein BGX31_004460 [Mortierella sp. GBA43]
MLPLHPLELPEIVSRVAEYVPRGRLPVCARVSKAWYQASIPVLWRYIPMCGPIPPESVQVHRHLVKVFEASVALPKECISWRFPNLEWLNVDLVQDCPGTKEFTLGHPTVSRLEIGNFIDAGPGPGFWQTLLGFKNLKDLTLSLMFMKERDLGTFWQLCTRLERLHIGLEGLPRIWDHPPMMFPCIKELHLSSHVSDDSLYLEMMQRCPSLTSIVWQDGTGNGHLSRFCRLASEGTWSDLKSVTVWSARDVVMTDMDLVQLLGGMKRITTLKVPDLQSSFKPKCLELLRPQFWCLKRLSLFLDTGLTSSMAQEVLSSCHALEEFMVPRMEARDIVAGKPWVCTMLVALSASFRFDPLKNHEHQPLVFDQLSRLIRLKTLYLQGYEENPSSPAPAFKEACDLRLQKGLNKLSTLRSLRYFSFEHTRQIMGVKEIEWINEHWTNLVKVDGVFNCRRRGVNRELRNLLGQAAIGVPPYDPALSIEEDALSENDESKEEH